MKSPLKSKTVWINILMAVVVLVPELANIEALKIPQETSVAIVGIVNILLRFVTKDALTLKK